MIAPLFFALFGNLGHDALNVDDGTHEFKVDGALVGAATVCAPYETVLLVVEKDPEADGVEVHRELTPRVDGPPFRWFATPTEWVHEQEDPTAPDSLRSMLEGEGATVIRVLEGQSSMGKAPITKNTPDDCIWDKRDYGGGSMEACLYMEGDVLHSVGKDDSDQAPSEYSHSALMRKGFFRTTDLRDFMQDEDAKYTHTVFSVRTVEFGDGQQIDDPCPPPSPPPPEPECQECPVCPDDADAEEDGG